MLKLLTDEHLSPAVAPAVKKLCRDLHVSSLHDWMGGHFLGASDETVLSEAASQGLTLVTFDVRTIPPLLQKWAEQSIDHGGVIFVGRGSYLQNDIGGIAQGLAEVYRRNGKLDWTNRYVFL